LIFWVRIRYVFVCFRQQGGSSIRRRRLFRFALSGFSSGTSH
jgi:hypothetical protein